MNQPVDIFSNKLIENILENDLLNDDAINHNSGANIVPQRVMMDSENGGTGDQ